MTDADALTILEDAFHRCGTEDMRTAEVFDALYWLECQAEQLSKSPELWPFAQFRNALGIPGTPFVFDYAGRGQIVNASLNGIRRVCHITTPRPMVAR